MKTRNKRLAKGKAPVLELHLYLANTTARSVLATENLQNLCEQFLHGEYRLTIIDLVKKPELAREHEIVAIPTLVRVAPGLGKTVIGCLSDTERVLRASDWATSLKSSPLCLPAPTTVSPPPNSSTKARSLE